MVAPATQVKRNKRALLRGIIDDCLILLSERKAQDLAHVDIREIRTMKKKLEDVVRQTGTL